MYIHEPNSHLDDSKTSELAHCTENSVVVVVVFILFYLFIFFFGGLFLFCFLSF